MKFVLPAAAHEAQAKAFVQEFRDRDESQIPGDGRLAHYLREQSYADWLAVINAPKSKVYMYFYMDEQSGEIIGVCHIRLKLESALFREAGHIGLSVRPTMRGQGYGSAMLREALAFCAANKLRDVRFTCEKTNTVSAKMIEGCGGVLLKACYSEMFGKEVLKYQICKE